MKKLKSFLSKLMTALLLICAIAVLVVYSVKLYQYNRERMENEKLAEKYVSESQHAAPISVDFKKLTEDNSDIIAWLYCEGTPLNYPVVRAEDNAYYLRRNTEGEYSYSGTLFEDCHNNSDFSDENTIIYGHNMKNDSMFGTLVEYKNQAYYDAHPEMYLLTPDKEFKVKLIAGVTVNSTSPIYQLPLLKEDKERFITDNREQSTFEADYTFSPDDRFVMLSTCSYDFNEARYVLIGLLEEL